ncbi:hypothetical protein HKX48_008599 [Thoreauomyces humboldtii]|nr:hypothetical protein HKX48_008599 [Thoreauomyces humboldtii]
MLLATSSFLTGALVLLSASTLVTAQQIDLPIMASSLSSAAANASGAATAKYSTLITNVLKLYTTRDPAVQAKILEDHYLPTATFEDPLMIVNGTTSIVSQFHALLSAFSSIDATQGLPNNLSATPTIETADAASLSKGIETLVIPNTQVYKNEKAKIGPKEISIEANTFLQVEQASGKVVYHKDEWLNHKFENPTLIKKASGATSSAIFKLFNIGGSEKPAH